MSVPVTLGSAFEPGRGQLLFGNVRFRVGQNAEAPFQVSNDGQRILALTQSEEAAQPTSITVVTNWQTTLKK